MTTVHSQNFDMSTVTVAVAAKTQPLLTGTTRHIRRPGDWVSSVGGVGLANIMAR